MTILRSLTLFTAFAAVAACSDQTGPPIDDPASFARGGRFATDAQTRDADASALPEVPDGAVTMCSGEDPTLPLCTLRHRPDAPPLEDYHPSFTILAGFPYNLNVFYAPDPDTGLREFFLMVTIPRDAEFFDEFGAPIPKGQPVVITMDLDPVYFHVEFGPHGALFNNKKPATVRFSVANAVIEGSLSDLSIHYRPQPTAPEWGALPTTFDERGWWVQGPVYHFSGYAVAW